jgi:hypothetical protein
LLFTSEVVDQFNEAALSSMVGGAPEKGRGLGLIGRAGTVGCRRGDTLLRFLAVVFFLPISWVESSNHKS